MDRLRKLVVISHTPHQLDGNGNAVGWGPTIRELDFLADSFEEVVHVACLEKGSPSKSSLPYTRSNIRLEAIPVFGGKSLREKLSIFTKAPQIISTVREAIAGASHVQIRVPMGIGIFLLPWFALKPKRPYRLWVKYANNWVQRNPPPGYALQRWFLKKNLVGCPVTLNGQWPGQPAHCLSFENPCLFDQDVADGRATASQKIFLPPFRLAFTGRLEDDKGVSRIIDALDKIGPEWVSHVDFIGDGPDADRLKASAARHGERVRFHGFRETAFVHDVLRQSHFFVLPTTASEGFPKVVAEAACHGSIPVVSDVSSIPHYVRDGINGIVWQVSGNQDFTHVLKKALELPAPRMSEMALECNRMSALFTFEQYVHRLKAEVFSA